MIEKTAKIKEHNIVLVGDFNPKIFQPEWFASNKLLPRKEVEEANIHIIHPDVVVFSLDWLRLIVTRNRFKAETNQDTHYEILRDLVLGTFSLLIHTPVNMVGLNYNFHFKILEEKYWHKIGDILAPKEIWKVFLKKPGMSTIRIESNESTDILKRIITITCAPSLIIQPYGLFVDFNDHYESLLQDKTFVGCSYIVDIIDKEWKSSVDKISVIIEKFLEELCKQ